MFPCVAHCGVSAIRHAGNMAAQIPSRHSVKTKPIQTLASDKCLLFVCKEDPMMSWLPRQYTRISGLFLMHGWNHIQGWQEAFHHNNPPMPRSFHTDVFLQIFQNFINVPADAFPPTAREEWRLWRIELLWIRTSVCPSKCLCVPAPLPWLRSDSESPALLIFLSSTADPRWDREPEFITVSNNLQPLRNSDSYYMA